MKLPILIPFLIAPLTPDIPPIPISIDKDYQYNNKIDYVFVEPLKQDPTIPTKMKIKVSFVQTLNITAYVTVDIITSNMYQLNELETFELKNVRFATIEYDYPNTCYNPSDTFSRFVIKLYSEYGDDSVTIPVLKQSAGTIDIRQETLTIKSAKNITVYRPKSGTVYYDETITFSECSNEIYLDEPYFDLNHFTITYSCLAGQNMYFKDARMLLGVHDEKFNDVGESIIMGYFRYFDLKLTKTNNTYVMSTKNNFYVNPKDLTLHNDKRDGYIKTNKFYFPTNCYRQEQFTFLYIFGSIGMNNYRVNYSTDVYASGKGISTCAGSHFCLSTEESTPQIDLGTKIVR